MFAFVFALVERKRIDFETVFRTFFGYGFIPRPYGIADTSVLVYLLGFVFPSGIHWDFQYEYYVNTGTAWFSYNPQNSPNAIQGASSIR